MNASLLVCTWPQSSYAGIHLHRNRSISSWTIKRLSKPPLVSLRTCQHLAETIFQTVGELRRPGRRSPEIRFMCSLDMIVSHSGLSSRARGSASVQANLCSPNFTRWSLALNTCSGQSQSLLLESKVNPVELGFRFYYILL